MTSAKTVKLPKDRNGQTLHIGDEVLVFNGTEPVAQGEVTGMTLHGSYRGQALSDKLRRLRPARARKDRGGRQWHRLAKIASRWRPS